MAELTREQIEDLIERLERRQKHDQLNKLNDADIGIALVILKEVMRSLPAAGEKDAVPLTTDEQRVFKRALLSSSTIVHPAPITGETPRVEDLDIPHFRRTGEMRVESAPPASDGGELVKRLREYSDGWNWSDGRDLAQSTKDDLREAAERIERAERERDNASLRLTQISLDLDRAWSGQRLLYNTPEGLQAQQAEARLRERDEDAERYRWLRSRVQGQRDELAPQGQDFVLEPPNVMPGQNIMQGSVAEHLDNAIDAARNAGGETG